jgi:predicted nucleic acid-binding protein
MSKKIVIDSNIAFSAMLNVDSRIGQILIRGGSYFEFFVPAYLTTEVIDHKEKIKEIANLSEEAFIETYHLVLHNITILHPSLIPVEIYQKAQELCQSIDVNDTAFLAITEFTKGRLWSGDLVLLNGLKSKGYKKFIKTADLYEEFLKQRR